MTHPAQPLEPAIAVALVATMQAMRHRGLNVGAAGNASARHPESGMWITPTGVPAETLTPEQIVWVDAAGQAHGAWRPSSEWHFHLAIYRARPDVGAVVHCHSPAATALACHRREIPPFHYMIAEFGGQTVRCARYARFGSEALAEAIVDALEDRLACLLANHGLVAVGHDLAHALHLAEALETLCKQYLYARALGEPVWLSEAEMAEVIDAFRGYGQQSCERTYESTSRILPPSS
ncbi:class II aldolase/adducin family protein [Hydrogenophilus thiooxidans]|uniref:class II aldolase/adducin family protein n=1 Tax=Hydrogenophilus thiooxidans TaxID=2820326 RepID=UPI001C24B764|nr:class II aldolase/adducin family protein [Hydrogenophilus thiooxidans]